MKHLLDYEQNFVDLYSQSAPHYDLFIKLYNGFWQSFGFRYEQWRKNAIEALEIKKGDTVIDLGCGTGLNFSHILKLVGKTGHVIGVDTSKSMLNEARKRIEKNNWNNVSLFHDNMNNFQSSKKVDAILATYSIGLSKDYDTIVSNSHHALKSDGRLVVLGFKKENLSIGARIFLPFWLRCIKDYSKDTIPFGSTHAWKSVKRHFPKSYREEFFGGLSYLKVGIK